jgi:hypothetical protein
MEKKEKLSAKPSTEDIEKEAKEDEEKFVPNIIDKKMGKKLYESYKRDLGVSEFTMKRAIKSVGEWVVNVETQRNLQMRNDFDEEKEYKLEKQKEIQNQIEELSNDNESEKMIRYFNEKILQQENLYKQYSEIKKKIDLKMQLIKDALPDLQKKVNKYKVDLRKLNRENLKLMEQINKFENQLSEKMEEDLNYINYNSNNADNLNINNSMNLVVSNNSYGTNQTLSTNVNNNSQTLNALNLVNNNNKSNSFSDSSNILNNSINVSRSINIPEILEKNEKLRKKMEKNIKLREILKEKKDENSYLMRSINLMNNNYFKCKKVYTEGMHEVAKELLRINEMELDKVINNSNTNFNSLYFDIFKTNNNGKSNNDLLRLPIINSNINKKFKYPIMEKSEPNDLLFKVIKNIIEENNNNNKINNMKKNKFSWEEFKDFSAYQIYTLLNINKDILNRLENCIFPTQVKINDQL